MGGDRQSIRRQVGLTSRQVSEHRRASKARHDDIDNGRLICVIGIAPAKPAEFLILRIQQKTLDNPVPN
jgi:phage tail sheath protein FI